VRVIAPSRSLALLSADVRSRADERLARLGLRVTFGAHAEECDEFGSSSVSARISDLHAAFADTNVTAILTAIGGFSCNQLLAGLDYDLIARHPKLLCGYSDITALQCAMLSRAGLVSYSGPHYSTFGVQKGAEYTIAAFLRCTQRSASIPWRASQTWSDDAWWLDQETREFLRNPGPVVLSEGDAEGRLIGGNLATFCMLCGTPFMPPLDGAVLFLEDEGGSLDRAPMVFDRWLQVLAHQPDFARVRCLLLGRFTRSSPVSEAQLRASLHSRPHLRDIPVVAGLDFGHTLPMATLPIGGSVRVSARYDRLELTVTAH
jgi:muramoyltetrapeptide carboxypeptidase LdcA involved in peptidoglycan recycling